jgi:hypothetical protein
LNQLLQLTFKHRGSLFGGIKGLGSFISTGLMEVSLITLLDHSHDFIYRVRLQVLRDLDYWISFRGSIIPIMLF